MDIIELTKQEALEVKDLHVRLTFAQMALNAGVREVCKKYAVDPKEYQLAVDTGQLVKQEKKNG